MTVSTTLSASEFTSGAGVTDSVTRTKQSYQHPLMVPRTAVLDPGATLATPQWLLACTALRSVDHAVETYCSPDAGPATEAQSLHGLRLLSDALPRMWRDPDDLAPRLMAQIGMWHAIAALAAGVPTGASHGIGYALGAGFGVAHGHTSCVLLPAVMRWNAETHGERQRAVAEAMGGAGRPAHELVRELVRGAGQPTTLREVGVSRDDLPELARRSLGYGSLRANPRPVRGVDDVLEILELAW
jgi:maleylacetate reductase